MCVWHIEHIENDDNKISDLNRNRKDIRVAFFDIDGTLHHGQTIWEILHRKNETWDTLGKLYLEQFLSGEIDFETFARRDVAAWKGLSEIILHDAIEEIRIFEEAITVMDLLRSRGCEIYLVSNGIAQLAAKLVEKHGLSGYVANPLHIENGRLSGHIDIVIPYQSKDKEIKKILQNLDINPADAMAVGDGPGDVAMLCEVGHPFYLSLDGKRSEAFSGPYVEHWGEILGYLTT